MSYPTSSHQISLAAAIDLTTRFRSDIPPGFPISETFTKSAIDNLLSVSGAGYLRIYHGRTSGGDANLILVAADADGNDILPADRSLTTETTTDPTVLEDGFRCPQYCPPDSPLTGS